MAEKICRMGLVAVVLTLLSASRGEANIIECTSCTCANLCNRQCETDTGTSTCGAAGVCVSSLSCTGCLTAGQADFILGLLDQEPWATPAAQEQGRAAARLTWRLAQYAEESGLGEVYTAGAGFRRSMGPRGVASPDLAFVSRERLTT